jgi:hypothetical protein
MREEPECDSDKKCISEKKEEKFTTSHTRLYFRSCLIKEI